MKKLFMTVTAVVLLSTASFADQNTENANRMAEMRMQFMKMTNDMVSGQMEMMKMHEAMLTNYQKLLKQMMENEISDN
jgi:ABC-type transport system involved in cytochrome bd biosynthesis fused ATPase/permease subunit